jgi:hypothetical protein
MELITIVPRTSSRFQSEAQAQGEAGMVGKMHKFEMIGKKVKLAGKSRHGKNRVPNRAMHGKW